MEFDNVDTVVPEARDVALPVGTFQVTWFDSASPEYQRILQKVSKPYRKLIEHRTLDPVIDRKLSVIAFVKFCVKGWKGVKSKGTDVPYSEDACVELLTKYPRTFYDLIEEARDVANYKPTEGDLGNSSNSSNTE